MMAFELCPRCCHVHRLSIEKLKPMVLSGDNASMPTDFEEVMVYFADSADAQVLSDLLQKATNFIIYGRD